MGLIRAAAQLGAVVILLAPLSAGADGVCDTAYDQAQSFRDARKLAEARDQLRVCARPTCPRSVVTDCANWLADVEARMPSVVALATDPSGNTLSNVTVSIDHGPPHALDGGSWDINPGQHTFAFTAADGTTATKSVLVAETQKSLRVTVMMGTATPALAPVELLPVPVAETSSDARHSRHVAAGVVGWAALDSPAIADTLAGLRELPGGAALVGIRHQVQEEPDPRWLCRPAVRGGLAAVGAAGLAYDLLVTAGQLPAAVETVRALPEVRFVLDHAGNPPVDEAAAAAWRRDVLALSRAENVTVKLSGLVTRGYPDPVPPDLLRSWARTLLDGFGPGRMMFGSDWPVCTLTASYDEVLAIAGSAVAGLSAAERQSVFAGTATRFYRLAR